MMDLLTLDTNIVRDIEWVIGKVKNERYRDWPDKGERVRRSINKLLKLKDEGRCHLGVTNQIYKDVEDDDPKNMPLGVVGEAIEKHVEVIGGLFEFDGLVWPINFPDNKIIEEIRNEVFPGRNDATTKGYRRSEKDARQLYTHLAMKRDYFITDDGKINDAKRKLLNEWGIKVKTLSEYIAEMI